MYTTGYKFTSTLGYVKFCRELDHISGASLVITIKPKVTCIFRTAALLLFLNSVLKKGIIFSVVTQATFRTPIATHTQRSRDSLADIATGWTAGV
jgi:hypothetical protein